MDRLSSHYFKPVTSNPALGPSSSLSSSAKAPAQVPTPIPLPPSEEFIIHVVGPRDTILGLSLKYGVSAQTILMANDLPSSGNANLSLVPKLKIPHGRRVVVDTDGEASQRALLREFRTRHSLPEAEAKYYLLEAEWDLARAGEILSEHLRFEAVNGFPGDGGSGGPPRGGSGASSGVRGLSSGSSSFTTAALKLSTTRGEGGGVGGGGGSAPSSKLVGKEGGKEEGGRGGEEEEEEEESAPLVKPTFPGLLRRRKGQE